MADRPVVAVGRPGNGFSWSLLVCALTGRWRRTGSGEFGPSFVAEHVHESVGRTRKDGGGPSSRPVLTQFAITFLMAVGATCG